MLGLSQRSTVSPCSVPRIACDRSGAAADQSLGFPIRRAHWLLQHLLSLPSITLPPPKMVMSAAGMQRSKLTPVPGERHTLNRYVPFSAYLITSTHPSVFTLLSPSAGNGYKDPRCDKPCQWQLHEFEEEIIKLYRELGDHSAQFL